MKDLSKHYLKLKNPKASIGALGYNYA